MSHCVIWMGERFIFNAELLLSDFFGGFDFIRIVVEWCTY
jgi:hypothetical protein